MWKDIRRMFINIVFVMIIYSVSYKNRDSHAIYQVNHLRNFFLNTRSSTDSFTEIISITQYWQWLQMNFISSIRIQPWYNGKPVANITGFLNDKSNQIIGWATMRQLRLRLNASCRIANAFKSSIKSCKGSYSIFSDERRSYAPGWIESTNVTYSSSIQNAFIYRSSAELDSYVYMGNQGVYGGGGYVYEFRGNLIDLQNNLTLLRELSWIDVESRAIMIQLNLYNPNVKFYTSVTILIEISNIGQVFPSVHIEPMQMYTEFNDFSSIFYLIIAFIFILFIVYFTCIEIRRIFKLRKRYFYELRSYIEWGIIGCVWAGVGVYIWRYHEARRIGNYFRQTDGSEYVNLQLATYINGILTFLLGFCCFFGTIRLLRLCHIYPHMNIFSQIFKRAFKDLISFTFMFFLLFFGFVILFYLLFVSELLSCSSLLQTSGMLFEMLLLKFDFTALRSANPFLGPFVFALFIYLCVFICFTMFVAIIQQHFRYVKKEMKERTNRKPGVLSFIIKDIAKRIGWKKLNGQVVPEKKDVRESSRLKSPVEQLSERLDQLIIIIQKIYPTPTEVENQEILSSRYLNPQLKRGKRRRIVY